MFDSLSKGNNPDRMKGALYVLGNKGTSERALFITIIPDTELLHRKSCIYYGRYGTQLPAVAKLTPSQIRGCKGVTYFLC